MGLCGVLGFSLLPASSMWDHWTQVGEAPERILCSRIDIGGDWHGWKESPRVEVMRPERSWEGADAPLVPSVRSSGGSAGGVER